jgi:hypothetical protein
MFSKEQLLENIARSVDQPISEVLLPGAFSDYRLSYGVHCYEPSTVYFLAIYPAFCATAKAMFHYNSLEVLCKDLDVLMTHRSRVASTIAAERTVETRDIIAAALALSRNKESIELFQEQREFMDLGVQHVHLDNYYQEFIRNLCASYFVDGTLLGLKFELSFLSGVNNEK